MISKVASQSGYSMENHANYTGLKLGARHGFTKTKFEIGVFLMTLNWL